jgi:hypothetical protein
LKVSANPLRHHCVAEIARARHTPCGHLLLRVTGQIAPDVSSPVQVIVNGAPLGVPVTAVKTGKGHHPTPGHPYPDGMIDAAFKLPGRNHEPGDRWTITLRFAGDARHGQATATTVRLLEAERHRKGKPRHPPGDLNEISRVVRRR